MLLVNNITMSIDKQWTWRVAARPSRRGRL